ncbi:MAG TPA: nitroreductase family protein [Anaerolineae bacterium]|jgi:nitroreductase|nr:nitroreductase family protein [Anaerolineae bacterium]
MELKEAIFSRRTVRNFLPDPVPKEVLEKVIKAGIASPSPINSQPWHFTVVTGQARDDLVKIIRKFPAYLADILALYPKEAHYISEGAVTKFAKNLGGAPAIILVTIAKKANRYAYKSDLIATASAIQNMQLTAWSLGLGTVCLTSALWIESEIMAYLGLKDLELVTVIPIGYRSHDPDSVPRNHDVITWIGFEDPPVQRHRRCTRE